MKRFMIWFCLTLTVVTLLLLSLSGCDGCILGDASEACIMRAVHATETSAAQEFHIQLTQLAEEK